MENDIKKSNGLKLLPSAQVGHRKVTTPTKPNDKNHPYRQHQSIQLLLAIFGWISFATWLHCVLSGCTLFMDAWLLGPWCWCSIECLHLNGSALVNPDRLSQTHSHPSLSCVTSLLHVPSLHSTAC